MASRGKLAAAALRGPATSYLQREYTDVPVVAEGKTIRLSPNVYVIPDENRRGVPNVGIIVGSRATLVVDPGMGMRSGEAILREAAKISKGLEIYIVNTHFHSEHTTGGVDFPEAARGDASIIATYREFFSALRTRVTELKAKGKPADEIGATLRVEFRARYPTWDQPLRVHMAATAAYALLP